MVLECSFHARLYTYVISILVPLGTVFANPVTFIYVCIILHAHASYTQVWRCVRIVESNKMRYLSIRMDELSGISPVMKMYINQSISDKTIMGIKKDRRIFLADVPTAPIKKVYSICIDIQYTV